MAAQHLPRDLVRLTRGLQELVQTLKNVANVRKRAVLATSVLTKKSCKVSRLLDRSRLIARSTALGVAIS